MDSFPSIISIGGEKSFIINDSAFVVGRGLNANLVIEHLQISRCHCTIKKSGSHWTLFNQGQNGTHVNGILYRANECVVLKENDLIKFADGHEYRYVITKQKENVEPPNDGIDPVAEEIASLTKKQPQNSEPCDSSLAMDVMDNELTCSICSELFIKAVTLTCSHTFCRYCVDQWRKSKQSCPICRHPIKDVFPTLVVDNLIEKFLQKQTEEEQKTRRELVAARETLLSSSSTAGTSKKEESAGQIEISDEEVDLEEEEDEDDAGGPWLDDYHDFNWDEDLEEEEEEDDDDDDGLLDPNYNGIPGRYYGGYGRCYYCNQKGHWANGCPWK